MRTLLKMIFCISAVVMVLAGCSHQKDERPADVVAVGTIAGPETKLMEVAKKEALKKFGLKVKIITFTDYNMPNQALEDREIDANAFQHYPFLLSQIRARGYSFVPVGDTFLYPMGLYSKTITSLASLKPDSKIVIPNDPSNEARALLLLEKAGLIRVKPDAGINATIQDVVSNPNHYHLVALSAAQLPRVLPDVALAAMNTNYAVPAGLFPDKNALFVESTDSPYVNLIVARAEDKNKQKIKELVEAYQSEPVVIMAKKLFGGAAVPGFKVGAGS
jgi:D-methionine transport system substrate-binding protein